MQVASLTAVNTTLAAAAGGVGVLIIQVLFLGQAPDIGDFMNGILTGGAQLVRVHWWQQGFKLLFGCFCMCLLLLLCLGGKLVCFA